MLIGVVGKPSSGKSTFFKATTLIDVAIAAYPFTTIKPNLGVGYTRVECVDKELGVKCNPRTGYCSKGIRYVPVELLDVAGLVPGAHEGKGLGNQFLNDLNQADVLIHVVDISGTTNEKGEATKGHDPMKDIKFLEFELDMWYYDILQKGWRKFARQVQQTKVQIEDALANQLSSFKVKENMTLAAISKLKLGPDPTLWTEDNLKALASELRKMTKPIIIACNKIDIPGADANYKRIKEELKDYTIIPCSSECELALREAAKKGMIEYNPGDKDFKIIGTMSAQQSAGLEFIKKNVLEKYDSTGVQTTLDYAVFKFLKYLAIFPGGVKKLGDREGRILPDCFLMPPGSTALDFANHIHTDLGKGFLYALDVRTKMRISGETKLKNRDIIEIVSAAK